MTYPYTYARVRVPSGTRQLLVLIENPDFNTNADLYYNVDITFPNYDITVSPAAYGFTYVPASNIISVQNNNYVTFSVMGKNLDLIKSKVTIVSMPDFTQLGSFTVDIQSRVGNNPTPNPLPNWQTITYDVSNNTWGQSTQLLEGFTTNPITLKVGITNISDVTPELWYTVSNTDPADTYNSSTDPASNMLNLIGNNETFTVSPNQFVLFATSTYMMGGTAEVKISNVSDNNAVLDTFNIVVTNI